MNILVTGSAGFLGREVVGLLQRVGHRVIGIDLQNEAYSEIFYHHDLRTKLERPIEPFDLCIHLASEVGGFLFNATQSSLLENELCILDGVTDLCAIGGCRRIIYTSSINVFEVSGGFEHASLKEQNQRTPYAIAKARTEAEIEKRFDEFVIIRPTNLFGSHQVKHIGPVGISHVIPDLLSSTDLVHSKADARGFGVVSSENQTNFSITGSIAQNRKRKSSARCVRRWKTTEKFLTCI